jgi:minor extracellular serine protease Vpr
MAAKPPKGGGTAQPQRDFTEAPTAPTQSEYYTVAFNDPAAASYTGGIPGLARTKPQPGEKLNPRAAAVRRYVDHLRGVHDNFRGWLSSRAPGAEVAREQFLVGNTLVYKLNGADPGLLTQGPGVKKAAPSWLYRPAMNDSVELISADDVWPSQGGRSNAGSGVKVGIIDTGIDDTHDFFSCKTVEHHGPYASGGDPPPFGLSDIVFDHGTHVSGTVGGCVITLTDGPITGPISGVAPGAELHDYNVFPGFGAGFIAFGGSAFSHDICEAIEDSLADGMDVINMSLGGSVQGPHDFLADCTQAAVDAGLVAAVAAGNEGPGDMTASSPGSAAGALTAGATTNSHLVGIVAELTSASGVDAYLAAAGDFDPFADTKATGQDVVNWTDTGGAATACSAAPNPAAVAGKIALISRGTCTFTTKVRNAENAGAYGVIVYNNAPGSAVGMAHDGTDPFPAIPAVMISQADGADAISKLPSTAVIDGSNPQEFPAEADVLAGFSSRGPTPFTYLIKPDVTAPGVNIYSSVFNNEFAMFQGTSMATPHLAGTAALVLNAHPSWSPADVKSAMVNTADRPATLSGLSPLARGGGRVNAASAVDSPLTLDPASVSFGRWIGNKPVSASLPVAVKNVSGSSQLCSASIDGSPFVSVSPTAFSIAAGATHTLTVALDAGRSLAIGDHSGDVTVACGSTTLKAPWWVRKS